MKYPDLSVQLSGEDGNAFSILGKARQVLIRGGVSISEVQEFVAEASSGDYDHLLQTVMEWMEVR